MSKPTMRAKVQLDEVVPFTDDKGNTTMEIFRFSAVCGDGNFSPNGESEDNTYSLWTPTGKVELNITNPALFGKLTPGEKYYLDFTKADVQPPASV